MRPLTSMSLHSHAFVILTLMLHHCIPSIVASTPPYNVYNYDLTTPQFTPDGRLKQIEYASLAPNHSSPLIIVALPSTLSHRHSKDTLKTNDSSALILATLSLPTSSSTRFSGGRKGQSRIVSIPIAPPPIIRSNTHTTFVPPIALPPYGSEIVLALSGVLSDNVALLQTAHQTLRDWQHAYGCYGAHVRNHPRDSRSSSCRVAEIVARAIGSQCQERSFGGGLRPFGASIAVCGVDLQEVSLTRTDPSGGVVRYSMDHREEYGKANAWVLGKDHVDSSGRSIPQRVLEEIAGVMRGKDDCMEDDKGVVWKTMQLVLTVLLDVRKNESVDDIPMQRELDQLSPKQVDMVLVTSTGGVQHLDHDKVQSLLDSIRSHTLTTAQDEPQ